jgi:hypothetical protein
MYYAVIIIAIVGCVAFLLWFRKKQQGAGAAGPAKAPQKGIIK